MAQPYAQQKPISRVLETLGWFGFPGGIGLIVVGNLVMRGPECTAEWLGQCYAWNSPFTAQGAVLVITGVTILIAGAVLVFVGRSKRSETIQPEQVGYLCPMCNRPMVWIPQYRHWFCQYCQRWA